MEFEFDIEEVIANIPNGAVIKCSCPSRLPLKVPHRNNKASGEHTHVAIKYLDYKNIPKNMNTMKWEMYGMSKVNHPNVLSMLEALADETNVYLVSELCEMDLWRFTDMPGNLDINAAHTICKQMARAVEACHDAHVAHRDIKVENFLVSFKNQASPEHIKQGLRLNDICIKLADFAFWCKSRDSNGIIIHSRMECGTRTRAPLEVLGPPGIRSDDGYDPEKADIFSLGVAIFEIVVGFPCWNSNTDLDDPYCRLWYNNEVKLYWQVIDHHTNNKCSDEFKDLLSRMLSIDPSRRPDIDEVMSHPWMTGCGRIKFKPSRHAVNQKYCKTVIAALQRKHEPK